jgi:hypothetical protein
MEKWIAKNLCGVQLSRPILKKWGVNFFLEAYVICSHQGRFNLTTSGGKIKW